MHAIKAPGPGQKKIERGDRDVESTHTNARVDPDRCFTAGPGDELRGAAWIAVVGNRDDVTDEGAKRLAQNYWLNGRDGGIERSHGPLPDDGTVLPPREIAVPSATGAMSMDDYLYKAALINTSKTSDRTVCFYLVRLIMND